MKNWQGILSPSRKKRTFKGGTDVSVAVDDTQESLEKRINNTDNTMNSPNENKRTGPFLRMSVVKTGLVDDDEARLDGTESSGTRRQNSSANEQDRPSEQLPLSAASSFDEESEKKTGIKGSIRGFFNRRKPTVVKKEIQDPSPVPSRDDIHEEDSEIEEESESGYLDEIFKRKQASMFVPADEDEQSASHGSLHNENNNNTEKSRRGRRRSVTRLISEARKRDEAAVNNGSPVDGTSVIEDNTSRRRRRTVPARPMDAVPSPGTNDTNALDLGHEQKSMRLKRSSVPSVDDVRVKGDSTDDRRTRRARRSVLVNDEENEREHPKHHSKVESDERKMRNDRDSPLVTNSDDIIKTRDDLIVNDKMTKRGQRTIPESIDEHSFSRSDETNDRKSRRSLRPASNRDGGRNSPIRHDGLAARDKTSRNNGHKRITDNEMNDHSRAQDNSVSDRRTRRGRRSVLNYASEGEATRPVTQDGDLSENALSSSHGQSLGHLMPDDFDTSISLYDSELHEAGATLSGSILISPSRRSSSPRKQKYSPSHLGAKKHLSEKAINQPRAEAEREVRATRGPSESSKSFQKDFQREDDRRRPNLRDSSRSPRSRSKSRSRARSKSRPRARSKSQNRHMSPTLRRSRSRIRTSDAANSRERRRSTSRQRPSLSSSSKKSDAEQNDRVNYGDKDKDRDGLRERDGQERVTYKDRESNSDKGRDRHREIERDKNKVRRVKDIYSERKTRSRETKGRSISPRRRSTKDEHSLPVSASSYLSGSDSTLNSFLQQIKAGNITSSMEEASRGAHTTANQVKVPSTHRVVSKSKNKLTSYLVSDEKFKPKQNLETRSTYTSMNKSRQKGEIPKSKIEAIALLRQNTIHSSTVPRTKSRPNSRMDAGKNSAGSNNDEVGDDAIFEEAISTESMPRNNESETCGRKLVPNKNKVNLDHSEYMSLLTVPPVLMNAYNGADSQFLDQERNEFSESGTTVNTQLRINSDISPRGSRSRSRRVARTSVLDSDSGGEREADILLLSPSVTKKSLDLGESREGDTSIPVENSFDVVSAKLSATILPIVDVTSEMMHPNENGNIEYDKSLELRSKTGSERDSIQHERIPLLSSSSLDNNTSSEGIAKAGTKIKGSEPSSLFEDKTTNGNIYTKGGVAIDSQANKHLSSNESVYPKDEEIECLQPVEQISFHEEVQQSLDDHAKITEGSFHYHEGTDTDRETNSTETGRVISEQKQSDGEEFISSTPMEATHVVVVSANRRFSKGISKKPANDSDLDSSIESDDEATTEEDRSMALLSKLTEFMNDDQIDGSFHSDIDSAASFRKANKVSDESTYEKGGLLRRGHTEEGEVKWENSNPPNNMTRHFSGGDDPFAPLEGSTVQEQLLFSEMTEVKSPTTTAVSRETDGQLNITRNPGLLEKSDHIRSDILQSVQAQDSISNPQQLSSKVSQDKPAEMLVSSTYSIQHNASKDKSTDTFDAVADARGISFIAINNVLTHVDAESLSESMIDDKKDDQEASLYLTNSPNEETQQSIQNLEVSSKNRRGSKATARRRDAPSLEPTPDNSSPSPVSGRNQGTKKKSVKGRLKRDERHAREKKYSSDRQSNILSPQKRSSSPTRGESKNRRSRETNSPDSRKSSWRPPRLKEKGTDTRASHARERRSTRRNEGPRGSIRDDKTPVEYNEEDVFMLYSWSGNTQEADAIQRERLALRDSIRSLSFYQTYVNIETG